MTRSMFTALIIAVLAVSSAHAVVYDFEVFTTNGIYSDSLDGMYVEVTNGVVSFVDLTFYNGAAIQSNISGIFFDDGSLLGVDSITNSPSHTNFSAPGSPGTFPGGHLLDPSFVTIKEFNTGAGSPPPQKGVNEGDLVNEWVIVTFELINGGTLADVLAELNSGALRIGIHITNLADGSSESAILVPEPATMGLLGLGGLLLLRRRRRH
ncbi:MAG: PEP-CTERM sorting domain-containing protein [Planctomycetota bacterium]